MEAKATVFVAEFRDVVGEKSRTEEAGGVDEEGGEPLVLFKSEDH